ncbi:MAG: methyl-accepting chemotaxis protein [Pseudomonadota bacterium]
MKWYHEMSIMRQLTIIVLAMVIGFVAIGFSYYSVLMVEHSTTAKLQEILKFASLVEKARTDLLTAQRFSKDFQITKRLADLEEFDTMMHNGLETIIELEGLTPSEDVKDLLETLRASFSSYQDGVYEIAEAKLAFGLEADAGLVGDITTAARIVESLINEKNNPKLQSFFLSMRTLEKGYLHSEQKRLANDMTEKYSAFTNYIEKTKLSNQFKNKLKTASSKYYHKFSALVDNVDLRNQSNMKTQKIADQIGTELQRLIGWSNDLLTHSRQQADSQNQLITIVFSVTLGSIFIIMTTLLILLARKLSRSLSLIKNTVAEVSSGNLDARTHLEANDELGVLGEAFDAMLDDRLMQLAKSAHENEQLNNSVVELMDAVSQLSERDLTVTMPVREDVTGPVADAINLMTEETSQVLSQIIDVALDVETAAQTVKNKGDHVSGLSTKERQLILETMKRLESSANTMTKVAALSKKVNSIAINASKSTEAAVDTVLSTSDGMHDIRETISESEKRIKRLGERSQEINRAVDIINNIAERTHVLALNASMQAAAAGDAGRGFAVVADEVQRLAESSRNSTSQIEALVNNIQIETADAMATMNNTIGKVVEVSEVAQKAGKQMQYTKEKTTQLANSVRQIAESAIKQAKVSHAVRNYAKQIQQGTEQTHEALSVQTWHTNNLVEFSKRLLDTVSVFKLPETQQPHSNLSEETKFEQEVKAVGIN